MLIYKEVAITSLDIKLLSGELFPCRIALSFVPLRGFGHQFFVFLQTCRPRRRCENELPHPDFVRGCLWVQLRFKFATCPSTHLYPISEHSPFVMNVFNLFFVKVQMILHVTSVWLRMLHKFILSIAQVSSIYFTRPPHPFDASRMLVRLDLLPILIQMPLYMIFLQMHGIFNVA